MKKNNEIEMFKEFTSDSEFTEEDALKFGREVSQKVLKRHKTASEELFGTLKGKSKKSTQQMKDEMRKELYND